MTDIITHNWTTYTNGAMTVSASSEYSGRSAWEVFNTSLSEYGSWLCNATTGWWKIDLGVGVDLLGIVIYHPNTISNKNRAPKNFTVQGSNNDTDWDTLLTVTDSIDWEASEGREFEFSSHGSYQYYKIDITANNGDSSYIHIAELALHTTWDGGSARITHAIREVLRDGEPKARITHAMREVLRDGEPKVRITHAIREVLREYVCVWYIEDIELKFYS